MDALWGSYLQWSPSSPPCPPLVPRCLSGMSFPSRSSSSELPASLLPEPPAALLPTEVLGGLPVVGG